MEHFPNILHNPSTWEVAGAYSKALYNRPNEPENYRDPDLDLQNADYHSVKNDLENITDLSFKVFSYKHDYENWDKGQPVLVCYIEFKNNLTLHQIRMLIDAFDLSKGECSPFWDLVSLGNETCIIAITENY